MAKAKAWEALDVIDHHHYEDLTPLQIAQDLWRRIVLSPSELELLGDSPQMAHSLEGRVPFLSRRLWGWIPYLSSRLKIQPPELGDEEPTTKYVLRQAAAPYVSDEVLRRRKQVSKVVCPLSYIVLIESP